MKTLSLVAWVAAVAGTASANGKVTVCIDPGANGNEVRVAQKLASRLFAGVGVRVDWRERASCPEDGSALRITMLDPTPENQLPGAFAYALPYEGSHIVVFYDRVRNAEPKMAANLLAYVFAHEITHVLEGIARHSEGGIMKAHWGREDRFEIALARLSFFPEDADLIARGLRARESGATPASTLLAVRQGTEYLAR